ncbi:hypothetical protein SynBOUM118_01026 [Synechococcus sp. BOUM118]|nr:hypothetical protein SynBOUM118_01026 [Synechococcus sp. BOUM118]
MAHLRPISPNDEQTIELDKEPDQLLVEHRHRIPNNSPRQRIQKDNNRRGILRHLKNPRF